jgi:hypothetical protein
MKNLIWFFAKHFIHWSYFSLYGQHYFKFLHVRTMMFWSFSIKFIFQVSSLMCYTIQYEAYFLQKECFQNIKIANILISLFKLVTSSFTFLNYLMSNLCLYDNKLKTNWMLRGDNSFQILWSPDMVSCISRWKVIQFMNTVLWKQYHFHFKTILI